MQKMFYDTRTLDCACRQRYALSEEIMMENAAAALKNEICSISLATKIQKVLILCGSGNNGADGYALARLISGSFKTCVFECGKPSSPLCVLQAERARLCGVSVLEADSFFAENLDSAVVVDCIFGSGFKGGFTDQTGEKLINLLAFVNSSECLKIACDVPTGLHADGTLAQSVFKADVTLTMGAQKFCLYSDMAKNFTGKIKVCGLGISRELFEKSAENLEESQKNLFLLEQKDMILPYRTDNLVNKGSFGNAYIACGEKSGASIIAANACLKFGAGLVTLIRPDENFSKTPIPGLSMEFLVTNNFGPRISALCVGMGLGYDEKITEFYAKFLLDSPDVRCVLDADILYSPLLLEILERRPKGCVLTPHPKEFSELLRLCGLGNYSVDECIFRRAELVEKFCRRFPESVLVAKGANSAIGVFTAKEDFNLFIDSFGSPALAKGGSGDALAGMICALLAQNYEAKDAAITACLAHSLAACKIKNNFALTPTDLIQNIGEL